MFSSSNLHLLFSAESTKPAVAKQKEYLEFDTSPYDDLTDLEVSEQYNEAFADRDIMQVRKKAALPGSKMWNRMTEELQRTSEEFFTLRYVMHSRGIEFDQTTDVGSPRFQSKFSPSPHSTESDQLDVETVSQQHQLSSQQEQGEQEQQAHNTMGAQEPAPSDAANELQAATALSNEEEQVEGGIDADAGGEDGGQDKDEDEQANDFDGGEKSNGDDNDDDVEDDDLDAVVNDDSDDASSFARTSPTVSDAESSNEDD